MKIIFLKGFCTPGFVMNMYGLLLNDPKPSKEKIEGSFDGNICRYKDHKQKPIIMHKILIKIL